MPGTVGDSRHMPLHSPSLSDTENGRHNPLGTLTTSSTLDSGPFARRGILDYGGQ